MTTPQFTLRHLLALVTVCAILCLILATGSSGRVWGVALVVTLVGLLLLLLVHALLLVAARIGGSVLNRLSRRSAQRRADRTRVADSGIQLVPAGQTAEAVDATTDASVTTLRPANP